MTKVNISRSISDVEGCEALVRDSPPSTEESLQLARGFNALSDVVRLGILAMLSSEPSGEICVCDFIEPLGKTQGTISHHLKILAEAGIVHGEKRGKWVWYSIDRERLANLKGALSF